MTKVPASTGVLNVLHYESSTNNAFLCNDITFIISSINVVYLLFITVSKCHDNRTQQTTVLRLDFISGACAVMFCNFCPEITFILCAQLPVLSA